MVRNLIYKNIKILNKLVDKFSTVFIYVSFFIIFLCINYAVLRVFICDQFVVPSKSMEPTLIPGDRILVNKLIFGGRVYKSFNFEKNEALSCWRAWGMRKIKPNDVVVFNYPHGYLRNKIEFKINFVYAKRCIGCPGDTVSIINGFYKNSNYNHILGDSIMQDRLMSTPDSILKNQYDFYTIPFIDENSPWSTKNFGPLYIPSIDSKITMNTFNYHIYKNIIEFETGKKLILCGNIVYLNEKELKSYTFKKNYYFMGGDNVENSKDSRYCGLVPEDFIIGVATRISYHKDRDTDKIVWTRFFKKIQ